MNFKKSLLLASCMTISSLAMANSYVGGNFSMDAADDIDLSTLNLKVGHNFTEHLSGEARLGFGIGSETEEYRDNIGGAIITGEVKIKPSTVFGLYGIAKLPNSSAITPYALLGYTSYKADADITASGGGITVSDSDSASSKGVTYGIGADYKINDILSINLEWSRFDDDGDIDRSALGLNYHF